MEIKNIFLFKDIYNWLIVISLLAIGGLVCQVTMDFYLYIYGYSFFGGWSASCLSLWAIFHLLILLILIEIKNIVELTISKKKFNFQNIQLKTDNQFKSYILFTSAMSITQLSCLISCMTSGIYYTQFPPMPNAVLQFYGFAPEAIIIMYVILIIIIVAKGLIFAFWRSEQKKLNQ